MASASADSLYSIFDEIIRPTVPGSRGAISAILDATDRQPITTRWGRSCRFLLIHPMTIKSINSWPHTGDAASFPARQMIVMIHQKEIHPPPCFQSDTRLIRHPLEGGKHLMAPTGGIVIDERRGQRLAAPLSLAERHEPRVRPHNTPSATFTVKSNAFSRLERPAGTQILEMASLVGKPNVSSRITPPPIFIWQTADTCFRWSNKALNLKMSVDFFPLDESTINPPND